MAASLKEALKKAYADKGQELPELKMRNTSNQSSVQRGVLVTDGNAPAHRHIDAERRRRPPYSPSKSGRQSSSSSTQIKSSIAINASELPKPNEANSRKCRKKAETSKVQPQIINKKPTPDYELSIVNSVKITYLVRDDDVDYVYIAADNSDFRTQAHVGTWNDERELAIGLDFGTSSIKVIIGDSALDKAFAVPFSNGIDIHRYLLPSRLYETASEFSLANGARVYRDLKLLLLEYPEDDEAQVRVTALLVLVIRRAIGWLLSEHRDIYSQTNIRWKLAVGFPAARYLDGKYQYVFQKISQASWWAALSNTQELTRKAIAVALIRAKQLIGPANPSEEKDVSVVPEIAAQIYGYVASNRFDRKATNLFLMVDVGAGTVDSSLFHVKQERGGKFSFTFYTSQVSPCGVMNLHRNRLQWWENALNKLGEEFRTDNAPFDNSQFFTDRLRGIPESFTEYFSGISVRFKNGVENPDQNYFMRRVVSQVRGETLWKTWKKNLLSQETLNGVPMFLCGGGARMLFYRKLEQEMRCMPQYGWLKAYAKPLEVPSRLIAPGLSRLEYDRLSVAFGLSFLEVNEVVKATPDPTISSNPVIDWRDNYVDKDQC